MYWHLAGELRFELWMNGRSTVKSSGHEALSFWEKVGIGESKAMDKKNKKKEWKRDIGE